MKKILVLSVVIIFYLLFKYYEVEPHISGNPDYPDGPTVFIETLHIDHTTNTFYKSEKISEDNLFSGVCIRYDEDGNLLEKIGIKNGDLHGPFDSWYDNGQKRISVVWKNGSKFKILEAYHYNGDPIVGSTKEIYDIVFAKKN